MATACTGVVGDYNCPQQVGNRVHVLLNAELCARFGVPPIDFDGHTDALLHAYDGGGSQHMEYLNDRGWYHDLPFTAVVTELHQRYGPLMAEAEAERDAFSRKL